MYASRLSLPGFVYVQRFVFRIKVSVKQGYLRLCVCVCLCVRASLCLLSDVAAVFMSACVIMRPQGAENSDSLTWRGEERWEAEGDLILLFYHRAQGPDTCESLPLLSPYLNMYYYLRTSL